MLSNIFSISKKELWQIKRDKKSLLIIFALPIFLLTLFGYAINLDINSIKLGIYDIDKTEASRDFINSLSSSSYFKIVSFVNKEADINHLLDHGIVQCAVVIPKDFSKELALKENAQIQFLIDGVDANTATIILNYVNAATRFYSQKFSKEFLAVKGIQTFQPINLEPQFSTVAESQQVAFQISQLASQLPTVILSGFIFPIESMPIQILSNITPAKYYIIILRDLLLKGVGFDVFKEQIVYQLIFATIFITIATIKTKKAKSL